MHRISLILSEIYQKFLPIAERSGITINLSCPDVSIQVDNPEQLTADLETSLNSALSRANSSEIQISVDRQAITITDPETVLSRTACALLSHDFVTVDSRVGFGTTISIALKRPTKVASESLETISPTVSPKTESTKPQRKPVKTDRKLARAAKKTDRKVKKLAKKAKKSQRTK